MSTPLNPLADNVIAVAELASKKTASGIYLPDNAAEKPKTAKVVAVGPRTSQVKVGDRIIYKSFSTTEVSLGKEDYIIVKEEDVLATVK